MHLLNEIKSKLNSLKPNICNDLNVSVNNFNNVNNYFVIPNVTEEFVFKELRCLDSKKSMGDDGINAGFLKMCTPSIVSYITKLINESIVTSEYPSAWKIAKITALFKGGDDKDVNNYRPISILSTVSKIIEKHVYTHLYKYFSDFNLLSNNQSGFRSGFSCETCPLKITNKWYKALNDGKIIGCIALEITKAFDVLNFDILLKKLDAYNCHISTVKWFQSYLYGRKQFVKLDDLKSSTFDQLNGVPQGSILGPLLFNIYINDMPLCIDYVNADLYADDTTLYAIANSVNILQNNLSHDLNNFSNWCNKNNLVINTNKSKCMIITSRQRRKHLTHTELTLSVNGQKLECVDNLKILGLIIDENLSWKYHIDNLCKNLSSLTGLIWRIRNYLSYDMKVLFYNSFILSRLDYCICIWGGATKIYLEKLHKIQKRVARIILNVDFNEMTSKDMFYNLKWMSIYDRIYFKRCIDMYKIANDLVPQYICDNFSSQNQCNYSLRSRMGLNYDVRHPKLILFQRSFLYAAVSSWNNLSASVRTSPSLDLFKRTLKSHILSTYDIETL